ncbi:MAG: hypothetical protein RLN60_02570 [Phycisphaerales bacterium]
MQNPRLLQREFPVRAIAACFALAAFCVAVWAGLTSGRDAEEVLGVAIVVMFVCQPLGFALGVAFKHASLEQIESYKTSNPIPEPYDARPNVDETDERANQDAAGAESASSRTETS